MIVIAQPLSSSITTVDCFQTLLVAESNLGSLWHHVHTWTFVTLAQVQTGHAHLIVLMSAQKLGSTWTMYEP